jgi:hypothetical protein
VTTPNSSGLIWKKALKIMISNMIPMKMGFLFLEAVVTKFLKGGGVSKWLNWLYCIHTYLAVNKKVTS